MKNKAVVIVSPVYLPHMGGVERYSFYISEELKKRGYGVFVVTNTVDNEPLYSTDDRGVEVIRIRGMSLAGDRLPISLPSCAWKKLKNKLVNYSDVYVIAQTNLYLLSCLGIRFAKRNGYKSTVIIHGSNYVCLNNGIVDKVEHAYEHAIAALERRNNTNFIAVSKASAAFAEKIGCHPECIAYNAIDYNSIEACCVSDFDIYNNLGIDRNSVVFTFAGRLIKEKGVLQLVKAFEMLNRKYPYTVLVIAGSGPLSELLHSCAGKAVYFTGQLPHNSMISVFKQTACFVLPSDSEGFPTTVLEAAACGDYVIAAPYGGMPEAVELVGNGFVMNGNSAEDIFEACRMYIEARVNEKQKEKHEDRVFYKEQFSWLTTTDKILYVLTDNKE